MCGICGSTSDPDGRLAAAMCEALRHRGPDEGDVFRSPDGEVSLGARRLKVLGGAAGRQPLANEDGTVRVAFNGEIYNHPTLRTHLLSRGHEIRGGSDTELLPHLYEEYGDDLVGAIEGMFAFAIWDARRERLLLGRDRFGEKPLFYARQGPQLTFASELTALVRGLKSTPEVDAAGFDSFFVRGYVPGRRDSILAGVRQVPPAHLLAWERGTGEVHLRRYWEPPRPLRESGEPIGELAAETGRLLDLSVAARLSADVEPAVFLSGGIDSTLVAALAARHARGRLRTFTVGYEGASGACDERSAARRVAALLGTDHHELTLRGDELAARTPGLLGALDQPLADPAFIPLAVLSELAAGKVTAAISGEGADELFGGYPRYGWIGRARRRPLAGGRVAVAAGRLAAGRGGGSRRRRAFGLLAPLPLAERQLEWVTAGRRGLRHSLYGGRLDGILDRDRPLADLSRELEASRGPSVAGSLMHLDQRDWLPDDVLVKSDRAGMLASLELRTPYLQRDLAEFAAGVAPSVHLAGGGKQLLRVLLEELEPRAPRPRKVAFLPPVAAWLRGPLEPMARTQIASGSLYEEGWIRAEVASRLLDEHRDGIADRSAQLWPLLAAGLWLDRFRGRAEA